MKTLNHLSICLFLSCSLAHVYAQDDQSEPQRGSVLPGFIITLKGDTVKGYLLNINLWMNQHTTFFYKTPDDRAGRVKYKPREIRAYQVGNRYYESVKYSFAYSINQQNFILRKVDGPVKYYVWYFNEDKSKLMSPNISLEDLTKAYVFDEKDLWKEEFGKRGEGEFTRFDFKFLLKFAKNMSEYIKEDKELAQKVLSKTKGYQGVDIERIIREYNDWKAKQ
jgi:hypothetical protein